MHDRPAPVDRRGDLRTDKSVSMKAAPGLLVVGLGRSNGNAVARITRTIAFRICHLYGGDPGEMPG